MNRKSAIILIVSVAVTVMVAVAVFVIVRRRDSSRKTGRGLVRYARSQLGRPYWWGTNGQTASQELLDKKREQWPGIYYIGGQYDDAPSQFGQRVHDCAGLIEAYMWSDGTKDGKVVPGSNGFPIPLLMQYWQTPSRADLSTRFPKSQALQSTRADM